jgi:excisionase family DNA binding protein
MMEAKYLRVKDACVLYSLSRNTLYKMMNEGLIDGDRTSGGHRRLSRQSLDDYFKKSDRVVDCILERFRI